MTENRSARMTCRLVAVQMGTGSFHTITQIFARSLNLQAHFPSLPKTPSLMTMVRLQAVPPAIMEEAVLFPMTLAQRTKAEATAASLKPTVSAVSSATASSNVAKISSVFFPTSPMVVIQCCREFHGSDVDLMSNDRDIIGSWVG